MMAWHSDMGVALYITLKRGKTKDEFTAEDAEDAEETGDGFNTEEAEDRLTGEDVEDDHSAECACK